MNAPPPIDLRSDTVTRPTPRMLDAMREAELGDDSLEGDPTVRRLEQEAAALLGKQAGLFVVSGTMANLVAALTHAEAQGGAAALVDAQAHITVSEGGGISRLAGLDCIPAASRGPEMLLEHAEALLASKGNGKGLSLAVVESSHNESGGCIPSVEYMQDLQLLAGRFGVPVHLDGARLFNAAAALECAAADLAAYADSACVCLSKGLSAPMGSVLTGSAGFIERARRYRRMAGGGLRQAGGVAAAGLVALREMTGRLPEDHANAALIWRLLRETVPEAVDEQPPQTNIVLLHVDRLKRTQPAEAWIAAIAAQGVLLRARPSGALRVVTHRHIEAGDAERAAQILRQALTQS